MSLTGKSSLSIRKKDVQEQKSLALGFKNLVFAHKATAGETGININSLTAPTEMSSLGFVNPNVSDLQAASMMFYRKNLKVTSSLRGALMDYLSYDVASNSQINFNGFTAEDGEIFVCHIDYKPITSQMVVDGRSISVTGELAVGVTDFSVGTPFEVGKNYQSAQVGAVLVFRNGMLQARNSNNSSTTLDGNYYEVDGGNGLGSVIRFNTAPSVQADNIMVVSNGMLVERPTASLMAEIESLAGQVDAMIPVLAAASGQPETTFQAAPNSVDLKTFGDQVIDHETRLDNLEADPGYVSVITSSTPSAASGWQTFPSDNNKITLPTPGIWVIDGAVSCVDTPGPCSWQKLAIRWAFNNGTPSAGAPAGMTVLSGVVGHEQDIAQASLVYSRISARAPGQLIVKTTTTNLSVFLASYIGSNNTNGTIFVSLTAYRLDRD